MTREEMVKEVKSKMCKDCGIYLGGGKCSDNCSVIEIIKVLEQKPKSPCAGIIHQVAEMKREITKKYNESIDKSNQQTVSGSLN